MNYELIYYHLAIGMAGGMITLTSMIMGRMSWEQISSKGVVYVMILMSFGGALSFVIGLLMLWRRLSGRMDDD